MKHDSSITALYLFCLHSCSSSQILKKTWNWAVPLEITGVSIAKAQRQTLCTGAHYHYRLGCWSVCCCQKLLTLKCPLVNVLFNNQAEAQYDNWNWKFGFQEMKVPLGDFAPFCPLESSGPCFQGNGNSWLSRGTAFRRRGNLDR